MSQFEGVLQKMITAYQKPIQYYLSLDKHFLHVNQLLGKKIKIEFQKYQCLNCDSNKKIFRQGFCYDCFVETPRAGEWIMKPELSKAHLDQADRNLAYEKKVQLQPHVVYLANSSSVKVGVTRKSQIPTRWIDQGAHAAIQFIETPNRYLAGIAEVALKKYVADKTNWRTMLKNDNKDEDLMAKVNELKPYLPDEVKAYLLKDEKEFLIDFPVERYPIKLKSLNLSKNPVFEDRLAGIKGQYLIFENDVVFNVRNSEGFYVKISL